MTRQWRLLLTIALILSFSGTHSATLTVERGSDLQAVIDFAQNGDTLVLAAKTFTATPTQFTEQLCGNCLDPRTEVSASYGYSVKNKSLVIIGQDRSGSKLVTNAGYGLYFENSANSAVMNMTVTGGKRDPDGNATDAAIVVRYSRVQIENVDIRGNDHKLDTVVVGIGGVFGREGADIALRNCSIVNNGWDGVALYRGASATIVDCLIKDGRGAGIGVTWDAFCIAYRNEVTGYWKGIGSFGTSWVIAHNNLVHDNLGWGMIATGQSHMDMANNVVYHNGNCGVAPWSTESRGRIVNNIIAKNGWREQCLAIGRSGSLPTTSSGATIRVNTKPSGIRLDSTGISTSIPCLWAKEITTCRRTPLPATPETPSSTISTAPLPISDSPAAPRPDAKTEVFLSHHPTE
jgi:hypothetical protein